MATRGRRFDRSGWPGLLALCALAAGLLWQERPPVSAQATPAAGNGIAPVVWQLAAFVSADGTESAPDDPSRYTLQLLPDGTYRVRADCNRGGGRYEIVGEAIAFSPARLTKMGCPAGSRGIEYVTALEAVIRWAYDGAHLVLSHPDGEALRLSPSLEGVVWEWRRFDAPNGEAIVLSDAADYTVAFRRDGTVDVRANGEPFRARYTVAGERIDIALEGIPRRTVAPDALLDRFLRDLDQISSFVFRDGRLFLALPIDAGIHEFAARPADATATPVAG